MGGKPTGLVEAYAESLETLATLRALDQEDAAVQRVLALCLNVVAFIGFSLAAYRQSRAYAEASVAVWRTTGLDYRVMRVLQEWGIILEALGEYEAARRYYAESFDLGKHCGSRSAICYGSIRLDYNAYLQGDLARTRGKV